MAGFNGNDQLNRRAQKYVADVVFNVDYGQYARRDFLFLHLQKGMDVQDVPFDFVFADDFARPSFGRYFPNLRRFDYP